MRVIVAVVIAAASFLHAGGSPAAHANIMVLSSALAKAYKAPSLAKRQVDFEASGIQIGGAGGLTLGGKDKKTGAKSGQAGGAARNQTAENLAALEGARQRANGTARAGGGISLGGILSGGSRGDKAPKPAAGGEKAQPAKGGDVTAVKEGKQFKDNSGITVDRNGNAKNVGGDLGITKGSDGSTSVGGASGINILSVADDKNSQDAEDTEDTEDTE
ncbi:hypothetical protein PG988_009443 [Apiospora saccharicola]